MGGQHAVLAAQPIAHLAEQVAALPGRAGHGQVLAAGGRADVFGPAKTCIVARYCSAGAAPVRSASGELSSSGAGGGEPRNPLGRFSWPCPSAAGHGGGVAYPVAFADGACVRRVHRLVGRQQQPAGADDQRDRGGPELEPAPQRPTAFRRAVVRVSQTEDRLRVRGDPGRTFVRGFAVRLSLGDRFAAGTLARNVGSSADGTVLISHNNLGSAHGYARLRCTGGRTSLLSGVRAPRQAGSASDTPLGPPNFAAARRVGRSGRCLGAGPGSGRRGISR